jgi:hypothetical protein
LTDDEPTTDGPANEADAQWSTTSRRPVLALNALNLPLGDRFGPT